MVYSLQGLQPSDCCERLVGLAVEDEQMRQCPQHAGISRRKLRGDEQVRRTSLCLPVTPVEIAQDVQQLHRVTRIGQVSIPSCILPSRSR